VFFLLIFLVSRLSSDVGDRWIVQKFEAELINVLINNKSWEVIVPGEDLYAFFRMLRG
jgi:hypothetical protein